VDTLTPKYISCFYLWEFCWALGEVQFIKDGDTIVGVEFEG
jgi:hypothetical protein